MDIAFEAVGPNGKFQKIISILVILVAPVTLFISVSFPFMTKRPDFLFKIKNSLDTYKICPEENLCKNNLYDYLKNPDESLINFSYDFDLYCDKAFFIPMIGTCFFLGGLIGSLLLSPLPDKYGREKIYKFLLIFCLIVNLNILFPLGPWHLILSTLLIGLLSFAYSMSTLIVTEFIDRNIAGIIMSLNNAIFPLTGIVCALYFIFFKNWKVLIFSIIIINVLLIYLSQKYLIESPRWLNSKNRFVETLDVFMQIAKINGNEKEFQKFIDVNSSNKKFLLKIFLRFN